MVNVPSSIWVDEDGVIVRPTELCAIARSEWADVQPPEDASDKIKEMWAMVRGLPRVDADRYVAAMRDWVAKGAASEFAMTPSEVVAASSTRRTETSAAAAHFDLGQHLHRTGFAADARVHFKEAHRLQPENWTYKRNAWELATPGAQGPSEFYESNWSDEVRAIGAENYYAPPAF